MRLPPDIDPLVLRLALLLVPGVGDVLIRSLVRSCGSPEAVFLEKKRQLALIPGVGERIAAAVAGFSDWDRAEEELRFIRDNHIRALFFTDPDYPRRLLHCPDAPAMLFVRGPADLNAGRMLGVVGTRQSTPYGQQMTESLIDKLKECQCTVVSGLAFGIDIRAHRSALQSGLCTVAAVAHGLDRVYPAQHRTTARSMVEAGGALISDQFHGTRLSPELFPRRNRIIAGLCDALVVVESRASGGAIITADIANSYSREVFAFPGRVGDLSSEGCLALIRTHRAALISSGDELAEAMGWVPRDAKQPAQLALFPEFNPEERAVWDALGTETVHADTLLQTSGLSSGRLSLLLLDMEMKGWVQSMPGKRYARSR
jgi:DNA processing protein